MQVYSLQPGMLLKRLYHRYFPADILKSLETACYPTLGTTVISFLLNYHIHCVEMPHQYKQ